MAMTTNIIRQLMRMDVFGVEDREKREWSIVNGQQKGRLAAPFCLLIACN
jgi:hypothetical protein